MLLERREWKELNISEREDKIFDLLLLEELSLVDPEFAQKYLYDLYNTQERKVKEELTINLFQRAKELRRQQKMMPGIQLMQEAMHIIETLEKEIAEGKFPEDKMPDMVSIEIYNFRRDLENRPRA